MTDQATTDDKATNAAIPPTAMVLAAGLGKRMLPITERMPKPLVRVAGKALIDHALDSLRDVGVERTIVNVHHLADQMETHLADRPSPQIVISDERAGLLDSGGGIARALPEIGDNRFYLLNADSFWIDGYRSNLMRLAGHWDDDQMDALLLVSSVNNAIGYGGPGDFTMDAVGRLVRRDERRVAPFAYAGTAILSPRLFANAPDGPFSLNLLFDRALEQGRLFGLRLDGLWLHVGTPEAIREAEEAVARSAA